MCKTSERELLALQSLDGLCVPRERSAKTHTGPRKRLVGKEQLRRCAETGDERSVGLALGDNGDNPRRATRWPRTEGEKRMKIRAPLLSTAIRLTYHI